VALFLLAHPVPVDSIETVTSSYHISTTVTACQLLLIYDTLKSCGKLQNLLKLQKLKLIIAVVNAGQSRLNCLAVAQCIKGLKLLVDY